MDDAEPNARDLQLALAQMGNAWMQDAREHSNEFRTRVQLGTVPDTMWPASTTTQRLPDLRPDDARPEMAKDHAAKRQRREHASPMQQELSPSSGYMRSATDAEALRRADAQAENALRRARMLEERRAGNRASATPLVGVVGVVGVDGCWDGRTHWSDYGGNRSCIGRDSRGSGGSQSLSSPAGSRDEPPF